jgi:luciferase family oxidoreductase group 1
MILSVLDQSPIAEGSTAGDARRNTIDLARWAEQLGYQRYWLAEHHGTPGLADASPEVMVGPVAAATSRLHVGTGGVMLPHYSPLKVAETFSMLSALFPGRIDLGLGRAAGTSSGIAYALQRDRRQPAPDDFHEQLVELLGYLENRGPSSGPFRQLANLHFDSPEPWLLGSSAQSGIWAAELGLPYVFADFINPNGEAIAEYYREHFLPSPRLQEPRVGVAAWPIPMKKRSCWRRACEC